MTDNAILLGHVDFVVGVFGENKILISLSKQF